MTVRLRLATAHLQCHADNMASRKRAGGDGDKLLSESSKKAKRQITKSILAKGTGGGASDAILAAV